MYYFDGMAAVNTACTVTMFCCKHFSGLCSSASADDTQSLTSCSLRQCPGCQRRSLICRTKDPQASLRTRRLSTESQLGGLVFKYVWIAAVSSFPISIFMNQFLYCLKIISWTTFTFPDKSADTQILCSDSLFRYHPCCCSIYWQCLSVSYYCCRYFTCSTLVPISCERVGLTPDTYCVISLAVVSRHRWEMVRLIEHTVNSLLSLTVS